VGNKKRENGETAAGESLWPGKSEGFSQEKKEKKEA
jgi:hypothetical protein